MSDKFQNAMGLSNYIFLRLKVVPFTNHFNMYEDKCGTPFK